MHESALDVVLVTQDAGLRAQVQQARPQAAAFECLTPDHAALNGLPEAAHWWIDLDHASPPPVLRCRRIVYFHSGARTRDASLPGGMFVRKPAPAAALTLLWAAACTTRETRPPSSIRSLDLLPGWLAEYQTLNLPVLAQMCIGDLPRRLGGFGEAALYTLISDDALTLSASSSTQPIPFSLALDRAAERGLIRLATEERPVSAGEARGLCVVANSPLPGELDAFDTEHLAPLVDDGKIVGLLVLTPGPIGRGLPETLPCDRIFAFLARALANACRFEQARTDARIDGLTGVFNHRWLIESLEREIRRSVRDVGALAIALLDIDGLKRANDQFGHSAGDDLLRQAAQKISSVLRQSDSAARIGGDEFVVILPGSGLAGAKLAASRILEAMHRDAPTEETRTPVLRASFGIAELRPGWTVDELLAAADRAMYAAKQRGGNQVVTIAELLDAPGPRPISAVKRETAPADIATAGS